MILYKSGVTTSHSPRDTPQINSVTERWVHSLKEKVLCLLQRSYVPVAFWWLAVVPHTICHPLCSTPYTNTRTSIPSLHTITTQSIYIITMIKHRPLSRAYKAHTYPSKDAYLVMMALDSSTPPPPSPPGHGHASYPTIHVFSDFDVSDTFPPLPHGLSRWYYQRDSCHLCPRLHCLHYFYVDAQSL